MPGSSQPGSSRRTASLLLRVYRAGGQHDEVYLAPGLTIGRTVANTVVISDDPAVDRTHACVETGDNGKARLRCIEPESWLCVGTTKLRELTLDVGTRFQIGGTRFECIAGYQGSERPDRPLRSSCPLCGATDDSVEGEGPRQCPVCHQPILAVRLDTQDNEPLLVPALYGAYRAERYVARGGMGVVLKGSHEQSKEPVAIKVLLPGQLADRRDAERFEREVTAMARVKHPNVVRLLDHGQSGRYYYLVLEWIEGPTLRQEIADSNRAGKPASFDTVFRWFEQVCQGLAAIHAKGMIHRDIKPSNILIGPDGVARIADFGIARGDDVGATSYTTTGYAPGTFEYMAPEQLGAPENVDVRADQYALGVTFYESLTGARPVGAWQPASTLNPSVPKAFDRILLRLLASRPTNRYASIHELVSAISALRWKRETRVTAYNGARNGAIWGSSLFGILGAVIGLGSSCLNVIISHDLGAFLKVVYWIAFPVIAGVFLGAIGGAIFAVFVADDGGITAIKPLGFRDVLIQIFTPSRRFRRTKQFAIDWSILMSAIPASQFFRDLSLISKCSLPFPFHYEVLLCSQSVILMIGCAIFGASVGLVCDLVGLIHGILEQSGLKATMDLATRTLLGGATKDKIDITGPATSVTSKGKGLAQEKGLISHYFWTWSLTVNVMFYLGSQRDFDYRFVPNNTTVYGKHNQCICKTGNKIEFTVTNFEEAFADSRLAFRLVPKNATVYLRRGFIWFCRAQYIKAIADFDEAVRLDPNNATAYLDRGNAWDAISEHERATADYHTAINLLNEIINVKHSDSFALMNRGLCHQAMGQYDLAVHDYETARRFDPAWAPMYRFLIEQALRRAG